MNKIFAGILLIMACSMQANAENGRITASAPDGTNAETPPPAATNATNANDAFCTAGTPCEVNRHRGGSGMPVR